MGLKEGAAVRELQSWDEIKSDQNGIESVYCNYEREVFERIKSDQNGIESSSKS